MKRLSMLTFTVALLLLAVPQIALANDDDHSGRAQRFGPYPSASGDSGTCGDDWALDTFNRSFTVTRDSSGSYRLTEDFTNGRFTTIGLVSPGACETSSQHGTVLTPGIQGRFGGFLTGPVTGGTYNPNGGCPAPCTGTEFVLFHFGVGATWDTPTWWFLYYSGDPTLKYRIWQNASPDLGGNRGDIATL